jgi:hypothetical protein
LCAFQAKKRFKAYEADERHLGYADQMVLHAVGSVEGGERLALLLKVGVSQAF